MKSKFRPITKAHHIRQAQRIFLTVMKAGACIVARRDLWVRFLVKDERLRYDPQLGIWSDYHIGYSPQGDVNRYWNAFGIGDPRKKKVDRPVVEINPATKGISLRMGGMFLRDHSGRVWVGHTGKIGGGFLKNGPSGFFQWYKQRHLCRTVQVSIPDGRAIEVFVLGRLRHKSFSRRLARFVKEVDLYKKTHSLAKKIQ